MTRPANSLDMDSPQFPPIDPALIDRELGAPVNPWPLLLKAMNDWRGLGVIGAAVFVFAIWS